MPESMGVEMGFGPLTFNPALKEKKTKMVKTEGHVEKGDSKS